MKTDYETFYAENWDTIVQYVTALTQDPELAKDITQNSFLALYERWGKIKTPVAYLYETARNEIKLNHRDNKEIPHDPASSIFDQPVTDPDPFKYEALHQAIAKLTPRQQEIVKLYFLEQLTEQEIADQLAISQQAVNQTISRAKDRLRELLSDETD